MSGSVVSIDEIMDILPHRYPFLLVDKIVDFEAHKNIKAIKNVSIGEPYFVGHFPVKPVMPGVLIIEALAQASGLLAFKSTDWSSKVRKDALFYLGGIDNARFKKVVVPGDQLELLVSVTKNKLSAWKFRAEAKVDGELACSADITCMVGSTND